MQLPSILRRRTSMLALLACAVVAIAAAAATTTLAARDGAPISLGDICSVSSRTDAAEQSFIAENGAAMGKMMSAMAIKHSGDVDRDFAAMMIPHHQGAIEMAQAELRHGRNEQLRRIAQGIIVEQQQEIAAMNIALDQAPPVFTPAPTPARAVASTATCPCLSN